MFGEIRTMTDERGETFFVGKDIAEALGYRNTRDALFRHVDDEDKTTVAIHDTGSNYKSQTVVINESGLYALVLSSKLLHRICSDGEIIVPFLLSVNITD